MSYEVTATRRRPQVFEDLIGQEFVVATLKNAITSGKIAHAYLFSGPRGCGKTTTARLLARALNCEKGPQAIPCGQCSACQEIARGSSLDVIEIDGASNTSVNDIRQIKDEVLFPPNSCRYKIYIIDEVHMLSTSAFNALLKTIEEPPPYVIFIFATTELHKVPATIKSRCQQFMFRLGSVEQIKNMLASAAAETGIKADDEALYWIARESTGSFRDAYTLYDQVAAFSGDHITYEKIRDKLGLVGLERLNELSEECVMGNTAGAIDKLDAMLQSGVSIEQFITSYADYIRSLMLIRSGINREALIGQSVSRYSTKVLNAWNPVQIERALSLFLNLYRDVRYSLNPRFEVELALSRLCWLSSYVSAVDVRRVVEEAKHLLQGNVQQQSGIQNNAAVASLPQNPIQVHNVQGTQQMPRTPVFASLQKVMESEKQKTETEGSQPPFQYDGNGISREDTEETFSPLTVSLNKPQPSSGETQSFSDNEIDLDALRDQVINLLKKEDPFKATVLMKSFDWYKENNALYMLVNTEFEKKQLELSLSVIRDTLQKITGQLIPVHFEINNSKPDSEQIKAAYPEVVNVLCQEFGGKVVAEAQGVSAEAPKIIKKEENQNDD
jgi:DNA polymerase-3 subunit gamma/tau